MALPETKQSTVEPPAVETPGDDTFVADRQIFWSRFTTFTTGAVVAIVVLLLGMLIFLR